MRGRRPSVRAVALGAALLAVPGCDAVVDPGHTLTLEVAEARVPCMGPFPQECFMVRDRPGAEPTYFYEAIDGFAFEPGWRYRIEVERRAIANPPQDGSAFAYRLKRVLSRTASPRRDLLERIDAAEALWLQRRPERYTLVQQRMCFCAETGRGPVRLLVRTVPSGPWETVEERVYVADGSPVTGEVYAHFLGVHELFGHLRTAVARGAYGIDVAFDERDGFPRATHVDWRSNVADDEIGYEVLSLEPR